MMHHEVHEKVAGRKEPIPTLQELKQQVKDPRLQALIGKSVIASVWEFFEGICTNHNQDFGQIVCIDELLSLQKADGTQVKIPVTYKAIIPAQRGKYKLITSGEEIINSDFLLSWRLDIADNIEASQWEANTAPHFHSIVGKEWDYEITHEDDKQYLKDLILSKGNDFIGKTLIIGITNYKMVDKQPERESKIQKYGRIVHVSFQEGIVVQLEDLSEFSLPPDITMLEPAPEGSYRLRSTGEMIANPDYMSMWEIYKNGNCSDLLRPR